MTSPSPQTWIAALQPGGEVAIYCRRNLTVHYTLARVTRITPTGRVVVGNRTFDARGGERTSDYYAAELLPATPEVRDRIDRERLVAKLGAVKWKELDLDKLRAVEEVLK